MSAASNGQKPVVVLDPNPRRIDEIFAPADLARLYAMAEVVWGKDDPMPPDFDTAVRDRVVAKIVGRWRPIPIADLPSLAAIMEVGGRHPSPALLDYDACFARGIRVLSCAPAFGPMVAEMALGMALAASRQIVDGHVAFTQGEEIYLHKGNVGTFTLYDQPVGLIGFGGLARALRPLLAPFRCRLSVYDPWLPPTYLRDQGVEPVGLEEVLATSKVIFVLAIPSVENQAMLDRAMLSRIQPGAVLVLMSRAHVVDFDALTDLLYQGKFRAAIDVFPQEPLPADHPIRRAPGVVLSAHRAGSVAADMHTIGHLVVNDLEAILAGLPPMEMQIAHPELVRRLP